MWILIRMAAWPDTGNSTKNGSTHLTTWSGLGAPRSSSSVAGVMTLLWDSSREQQQVPQIGDMMTLHMLPHSLVSYTWAWGEDDMIRHGVIPQSLVSTATRGPEEGMTWLDMVVYPSHWSVQLHDWIFFLTEIDHDWLILFHLIVDRNDI